MDTGADDIIFPRPLATGVGVNLSRTATVTHRTANGGQMVVEYAEVELRLAQSVRHYIQWRAMVGFANVTRALFGIAGGLEFFRTTLDLTDGRLTLTPLSHIPATAQAVPSPEDAAKLPV